MSDQFGNANHVYDLSSITPDTLIPVVRQVIKSESAVVSDWAYDRVQGGAGDVGEVLSAIFRFHGGALDQGNERGWSVILKVVGTTAKESNPSETRYWKREVLAYQSGQLTQLPGGFTSPQYYGTHVFAKTVVGLWLEDITDEVGQWQLEHYRIVARHLGRFNGHYLVNQNLPDWDWLSRKWLTAQVSRHTESSIERFKGRMDDPDVQRLYMEGDQQRILKLVIERQIYLDALERLPQTLLHRDAFRRNLFIRYDDQNQEELIAVDWTYVGIGAIGEELVSLVHGTLAFSEIPISQAQELEAICFQGYVEGLNDAGWQGDPRLVRLGYAAGSSLCFGIGYGGLEPPPEERYPWLEQAFGLPINELISLSSKMRHMLLDLADEARELMASL